MDLVREKSARKLTIEFRNDTNTLATPTAVTYRIDCLTTGQQVRAWTAVAPAAEVQIPLTSSDNAIFGHRDRELRLVTVIAAYGPSEEDQATSEYVYAVRNLRYVQ
jgi:hypothetical protein